MVLFSLNLYNNKMGTNSSKSVNDNTVNQTQNKDDVLNSDPRSPTPEIIRTPLQVNIL